MTFAEYKGTHSSAYITSKKWNKREEENNHLYIENWAHWALGSVSPETKISSVNKPKMTMWHKMFKRDTRILQPASPHKHINPTVRERHIFRSSSMSLGSRNVFYQVSFKTVNSLLILQFHKFYSSIHCSVTSMSMYLQIYIHKVISGNLTIPEMQFKWHRRSVPRNNKWHKSIQWRN